MKQKSNNELRRLAKRILELEDKLSLDNNDKCAKEEIENIMCSISYEEAFKLDEYIYEIVKKKNKKY